MKAKKEKMKMQFIFDHHSDDLPEYKFSLNVSSLGGQDLRNIAKFVQTVRQVSPHFKKKDRHVTVGMKILRVKAEKFYGTYSLVCNKTLMSHKKDEDLMGAILTEVEALHKEIEGNMMKYPLKSKVPEPFRTL